MDEGRIVDETGGVRSGRHEAPGIKTSVRSRFATTAHAYAIKDLISGNAPETPALFWRPGPACPFGPFRRCPTGYYPEWTCFHDVKKRYLKFSFQCSVFGLE